MLHEETKGVSDPTRDEVGGVAKEDAAVGQRAVPGVREVRTLRFLRNRLPTLDNLHNQ